MNVETLNNNSTKRERGSAGRRFYRIHTQEVFSCVSLKDKAGRVKPRQPPAAETGPGGKRRRGGAIKRAAPGCQEHQNKREAARRQEACEPS